MLNGATVNDILAEYKRYDVAEIADRIGVKYSSLQRILNPHDPYDLGVCKLVSFIDATQDFSLLDHIEARLGRVAVKINGKGKEKMDAVGLCRFVKETSEALHTVSEALEDGKVTREEARKCSKELMDMVQVAMNLMQACSEIVEK